MNTVLHKFSHLTRDERVKIEIFLSLGYSMSKIAKILCRHKSTISREIARCKYVSGYQPNIAQTRANKAKLRSHQYKKIANQQLLHFIHRHLKRKWSPEVICVMWNAKKPKNKISYTTIYTFIQKHRPEWNKYLIYKGKYKYKRKYGNKAGISLIPNRTDIQERPDEINSRENIGDFEADTVLSCKGGKSCLAVFVERKTRYYKVIKMKDKTAYEMELATYKALSGLTVNSITYDNGSENVRHQEINKKFGSKSFFCRAYRSADKGSVENRNKILRQFLHKKTNFDLITQEQIDNIVNEINERPMKLLGWLTPNQAFLKHKALQFQL